MCGRATLTKKPKEIAQRFQLSFELDISEQLQQLLPTYNIAPTHFHPVIINTTAPQLQLFKWGLIPSWAKDASIASKLINARIETITNKPAFKAIHTRRCLIPFDSFYEWKRVGKTKTPYRILLKDQSIFAVAGIWETWNKAGTLVHTFSILTQAPNKLLASIHNRMPAILSPEQENYWLDNTIPLKDLLDNMSPYPSELMDAYPVSSRVGKVANNDATLIERDFPKQGTLFD